MIKRFLSQAWLYHKGRTAAFQLEEFLCFDAGYPLITLIFYCLLASYSFHTTNLTHWVIGNAFLMCTNTCVFSLGGVFTGERYNGRLRSIVAAPCDKLSLVLANSMFPALISCATVAVGFFIGGILFGIDYSRVNLLLVIVTILCATVAAACFGLLLSVFGLLTDSMHLILNIVSYVLMIFTGAEFPISQLPTAGQFLSHLLPLTRSIQAMNLLLGNGNGNFASLLAGELAIAAAYALLAWMTFHSAERACRRSGKFDMF